MAKKERTPNDGPWFSGGRQSKLANGGPRGPILVH